jgi:hypothetical protein
LWLRRLTLLPHHLSKPIHIELWHLELLSTLTPSTTLLHHSTKATLVTHLRASI